MHCSTWLNARLRQEHVFSPLFSPQLDLGGALALLTLPNSEPTYQVQASFAQIEPCEGLLVVGARVYPQPATFEASRGED
jgi:hypothetical protein